MADMQLQQAEERHAGALDALLCRWRAARNQYIACVERQRAWVLLFETLRAWRAAVSGKKVGRPSALLPAGLLHCRVHRMSGRLLRCSIVASWALSLLVCSPSCNSRGVAPRQLLQRCFHTI
jgi:hypothetical protein